MLTSEVLRKARALVEGGFCQHVSARLENGAPCSPFAPRARQFCALGAVERAGGELDRTWLRRGTEYLKRALPEHAFRVVGYNDDPGRRPEDILALFDRAITLAEAEESSA